jgi:hypothetical protein
MGLLGHQSDVSPTELDAKIRELPYKGGWRFNDDQKRCLPGTRKDFLEHITKWVEAPNSKHGLVLLGQAGTGKSSIAHEVAQHFEKTFGRKVRKTMLTSSSRHLRVISPIVILLSNSLSGRSSRIIRLFAIAEVIVRSLKASFLNRSKTYLGLFLVQFSSLSMHWMRAEMERAKMDYIHSLLDILSTSLHSSAYSLPQGQNMASNLHSPERHLSALSTWMIPNWLPRPRKTYAYIFGRCFIRTCSRSMASN